MHRVFVYGTLKKGQPNHYLIENVANGVAKYLGEGATVQRYPLVVASKYNIPFLLDVPGEGKNVRGDVFEVDDRMLHTLHDLEKHPVIYTASPVEIQSTWTPEPATITCMAYLIKDPLQSALSLPFMEVYDSHGLEKEGRSYVLPASRPAEPDLPSYSHYRVVKDLPEVVDVGSLLS